MVGGLGEFWGSWGSLGVLRNWGDTVQYHGSLRSRELGQAPMLQVFLTPRQGLSSHPLKQMVWLYWLQDIEIVCLIGKLSTILQYFTRNEIQWPTAASRWYFALRDVSHRQSCYLPIPSHPWVPPEWPYCQQAQCGRWRPLKWSIADLLTSSHPEMSASHLLGLQVRANGPSSINYLWMVP